MVWPGFTEPGYPLGAESQIYATCAQIQVESDTVGELPKGVLIPEALNTTEPG